ncbi:phosphopantetheine-binding protein [Pseudoduganella violacea]|uniref:Acyl carrier protein n=1 Tax=Pseudoduganella violacea TaxID=1715466 RepID=A0A7W5FX16_9BURK|nr:phosphopantetheine-binding protein [Pseudoduganella violacea]MBB3121808.1 acyl carrier protein [Pseudoduganella violacea]
MTPAHEKLRALWLSREREYCERLAAFVVPASGAECDPEQLRAWLRESLPHYMIPELICTLAELPLNAAGKLDRSALRLPGQPIAASQPLRAPSTPAEQTIAALIAQVLGACPDSIDHDFFADLGGHSLAATRLATLIRRAWPIAFPLRVVFENPTVAAMAAYVDQACADSPADTAIPRLPRRTASDP